MLELRRILAVFIVASLFLSACSRQQATEVTITVKEFGIESSITEFQPGVPYRFVVTNSGAVNHEIMIMPPLTEDQADMGMHMDMEAMDQVALAMIPAEDLAPGSTKSFDLTFTEPAATGTLEFACHTPGHYEANMKLPITVK